MSGTPRQPHLLIAEDNQLVCDALRILFEGTGHRVSTAGRVEEVIAIAVRDPADVLLLDLGLADGDGLEVLAELRARDAMPRVSVALTGREEPDVEGRCLAAGCVAVLIKPVPARELLIKVRAWCA